MICLSARGFAFHLLFACLVDLINIQLAFAVVELVPFRQRDSDKIRAAIDTLIRRFRKP